jgi:2-polyprenyl-3-methyl-5-hydroxy-6-metoxy-1,4-benzoquinol methylase
MNSELDRFRKNASEESLGSSSDIILNDICKHIKEMNLSNIKKILDIGCGQGALLEKIKGIFPDAELTGIDYSSFSEWKESGITFIQHDCNTNLPNTIGEFDLIISSEVIEHIENGRHFIREVTQKLNSGGISLISTPNIESYTSLLSFFFRGHHSAFGGASYPAHILPVSAFDMSNMFNETKKMSIKKIHYIKNGRIPKTNLYWKSFFPFLSGKRFSDNYFMIAKREN